jgi:mRNA-degrading endonuclease toxin of MazEF toxin-antitoxin module
VSKQRLRDRVGEVSAPELAALEEALREVLDLG